MKPSALLVYGSESRHKERITLLKKYLLGIECSVRICSVEASVPSQIEAVSSSLASEQPMLFVYNGHGNEHGWENNISYHEILPALSSVKNELVIINQTCHGASMIPHLEKMRSPENTGFIAPWDSQGITYGGSIEYALQYWPRRIIAEDIIAGKVRLTTLRQPVEEYPTQQRWGKVLDSYFFP